MTTQLEFTATENRSTQCGKILDYLTAHKGEWVPMPKLWEVSGAMAVATRVSNLRHQGHHIIQENRNDPVTKVTRSFYQLL